MVDNNIFGRSLKIKLLKDIYCGSRNFDSSISDEVLTKGSICNANETRHGATNIIHNGKWYGIYDDEFKEVI
jgi:hypothetical protein